MKKEQIIKNKKENNLNNENIQQKDYLEEIGSVVNYLDDHPSVGIIISTMFTAGGIASLVYYGIKVIKT